MITNEAEPALIRISGRCLLMAHRVCKSKRAYVYTLVSNSINPFNSFQERQRIQDDSFYLSSGIFYTKQQVVHTTGNTKQQKHLMTEQAHRKSYSTETC